MDSNSTPGIEGTPDCHLDRVEELAKIIMDEVYDLLMEASVVPEGPEVQLEGLGLDHPFVRNVGDGDGTEVRLACLRAHASPFRTDQCHIELAFVVVREPFEYVRIVVGRDS